MKRAILCALCTLLLTLSGCGSPAPSEAVAGGDIDLGNNHAVYITIPPCGEGYAVYDGEIRTNSTCIQVSSPHGYQTTVYLFHAASPDSPILEYPLSGHDTAVFSNLTAAASYLVGIDAPGSAVPLLLEA